MHIAIFAALQWECRPILRHLGQSRRATADGFTRWTGTRAGLQLTVVKTGIGLARAEAAARAASQSGPFDLFVSSGCAGALAPQLGPGDLVIAESVGSSDGEALGSDDHHRRRAIAAAEAAQLRRYLGPLLTSATVLAAASDKRAAASTGFIAVEMEGAAIARVAAEAGIPFLAVRSILDSAATELDLSGRFVDPSTGAVRPAALARHLLRHPGSVRQLLAMKKMMDAAEETLARFFGAYLSPSAR